MANRNRMKGHCMHCAACPRLSGFVRGAGWASRAPLAERRLLGRSRRLSRREVPADQER